MFIVKGVTIGVTTLYFTATLPSGHVVTSIVKEIQVYPPMRWSQRDIWLVTGAEYKVGIRRTRQRVKGKHDSIGIIVIGVMSKEL